MLLSYNPGFTFYPETNLSVDTYENTMTGIALSLIEQKNIFQGLNRIPTKVDTYNTDRVTK